MKNFNGVRGLIFCLNFFLIVGAWISSSTALANSCNQVKKCITILSQQGTVLTSDWQPILKKIIADLSVLEAEERKVLIVADKILDRTQLPLLKVYKQKLIEYDKKYQELLDLCSKGLKKISQDHLLAKTTAEKEEDQKNKSKISEILKDHTKKEVTKRGLLKLFSRKILSKTKNGISIVDREEIDFIFSYLQNKEHIPFKYPDDGCYARAHEMVSILEKEMGLKVGKVFLKGGENYPLKVKTANHPSGCVNWTYHVAPYLYLREKGEKRPMVLDPSLFTKPEPVMSWAKYQIVKPFKKDSLYFTSAMPYFSSDTSKDNSVLESYGEANKLITDICLKCKTYLQEDRKNELEKPTLVK